MQRKKRKSFRYFEWNGTYDILFFEEEYEEKNGVVVYGRTRASVKRSVEASSRNIIRNYISSDEGEDKKEDD